MAFGIKSGKKHRGYEDLIKVAGYHKPTQLQQLALPAILDGRDLVVESELHPGKTLSIVIPIMFKTPKDERGIKALILTRDREQAQKIMRTFSRSLSAYHPKLTVVSVGFSDLVKKEARQLEEKPDVLIGTPSRVIDHLRRANIDLGNVERVFIDEEEATEPEFEADVCFIFSKVKASAQIVRFTFERQDVYANIDRLMKRPIVIKNREFIQEHAPVRYAYYCVDNKEESLFKVLLSLSFKCAVIVVDSPLVAKKIAEGLLSFKLYGICLHKETKDAKIDKAIDTAGEERLDFIVTPPETLAHLHLEGVTHLVNYDLPRKETELERITCSDLGRECTHSITLVTPAEEQQLLSLQERANVNIEKKEIPHNDVVLQGTIERLLKNAKGAEELNDYLKAVKRSIPLGKRTLFISYLLKETLGKLVSQKVEFATLFLSIGRLRGVMPKDIAALFHERLALGKAFFGDIRVFDNYSFVEIARDQADRAIQELDQIEFKGRKLIVNYSRNKPEKRNFGARRNKRG